MQRHHHPFAPSPSFIGTGRGTHKEADPGPVSSTIMPRANTLFPADDEQRRRYHTRQRLPRQIRASAARDDRAQRIRAFCRRGQRGPRPRAGAEVADPEVLRVRLLCQPVGGARQPVGPSCVPPRGRRSRRSRSWPRAPRPAALPGGSVRAVPRCRGRSGGWRPCGAPGPRGRRAPRTWRCCARGRRAPSKGDPLGRTPPRRKPAAWSG